MANKKFSEFVLKTSTSDVSHIVGYNGAENVQITPANFLDTTGGPYLPLAGGLMVGNTTHNDNVKSIYGTASDGLEIYHDGNNSYIDDSGTGDLAIRSNFLKIEKYTGETMATFNDDNAVSLYYNNSKKFETTSTGISVTGKGLFSDDITIQKASAVNLRVTDGTQNVYVGSSDSARFGLGAGASIIQSTGASFGIGTIDENALRFGTNNNEVLTLDSSGNSTFASTVIATSDSNAKGISILGRASDDISELNFYENDGTTLLSRLQSRTSYFFIGSITSIPMLFGIGGAEKMRLDTSGNLGLGTSSPAAKLEVSGAANGIIQSKDTTGAGSFLRMLADVTAENLINWDKDTDLRFATSDSDFANFSERMRLTSAGNLGVGGNPNRKIHCYGELAISNAADTGALLFITASDSNYIYSRAGNASSSAVPLLFMTGNSEKMRLTSAGELLKGTTAAVGQGTLADLNSTEIGNGYMNLCRDDTATIKQVRFGKNSAEVGSISTTGSATAYNTSSDYRLKEDLKDFKGLDLVSKIPVYDYKWKADDSRSYGVMAHELEEVLPQAVTGDKDAEEMQAVDYSKIVPLLVKSIQELSAKLEAIECQCEKK